MKCIRACRLALLETSGELSAVRRRPLERHLAGCPDCRRFRDEGRLLAQASRAGMGPGATPETTMRGILYAASNVERPAAGSPPPLPPRPSPGRLLLRSFRPRPIWVLATALALLAAARLLLPVRWREPAAGSQAWPLPGSAWDQEFETDLLELETLLAHASSPLDDDEGAGGSYADELDRLAAELLDTEDTG